MFSKKAFATLFNNRLIGLLTVFILSVVLLSIFYGTLIFSLNTTFFSTDGDGIQCYYNSFYLEKYDTSWMFSRSMNYPYGETSFYTLSQPLVSGTLKVISNNLVDVTPYTVGVINFLMLFSVVLGAVFLYLFFTELGVPAYFAVFVSAGIAFLSPQLDRFPGHFTLSYVFAIPLLLYLLMLFNNRKRKLLISSVTGAVLFILMTCHVYYLAFFGIAILFYWAFFMADHAGEFISYRKSILYFTLQLIVPVAVFYLLTNHYSYLSPDRPTKPWGFLVYKASPESVLLPLGVDYGRFLHKLRNFNYVQWEGVSYVGITAAIGFFFILGGLAGKLFKRHWKSLLWVTDNYFLNIMFWASLAALLYSFGIPFIFGLDFLVDYLGPLQQMQSIGRFAWLFYFVINIIVFYNLWQFHPKSDKKYVRFVMLFVCLLLLYMDVYYFLKNRQGYLHNKFDSWTDVKNANPDDQWVRHLDPRTYQAIIPLPFYHMGSDNYGVDIRCNMLPNSFLASMKTGLPIAAIYMSRASVSQSIKSVALVMEPYRDFKIIRDMPDKKPFLIVAAKCNEFTEIEKNILQMGVKIDSGAGFNLYRLEYDSLVVIPHRKSEQVSREFAGYKVQNRDAGFISPGDSSLKYLDFDSSETEGYRGNALQVNGRSSAMLFDNFVSAGNDSSYLMSFWISPIDKDLFPKTRLEIELFNDQGARYDYKNEMISGFIKTVDNSWGLVEYRLRLARPRSHIKIAVYNTQIARKQSYLIDEMLIRPESRNVFYRHGNFIVKNNRWYYGR